MGYVWFTQGLAGIIAIAGCGFPRPAPFHDDGGVDDAKPLCTANQALRCDGNDLVRCNGDGTAETRTSCSLGCNATMVRCLDVNPSNGLASYLDMAATEQDLDLGAKATINTDDGTVVVDGRPLATKSATISQSLAPAIRVFIVRSLTSADVTIVGQRALAVVSHGDIKIGGGFLASSTGSNPGPGRYNDGSCQGLSGAIFGQAASGSGGGGFGNAGGKGGTVANDDGSQPGGAGGSPAGNSLLIPLRGGCDGASSPVGNFSSGGGGAIQLVSRTEIAVTGVIAANGSSGIAGGGSGGGILLEAPLVEIAGNVVANGGGGGAGCLTQPGEAGRPDNAPAAGGSGCSSTAVGNGGDGAAGNTGARDGASINLVGTGNRTAIAGHGGGGSGRIRVNTAPGGLHRIGGGLFSPNPSTGALATR